MKMEETITDIANKILNLETLETRMCDRLDFHELSVWSIKKALETAYTAGRNSIDVNKIDDEIIDRAAIALLNEQ